VTPEQLAKLQLAYDRAKLNLQGQREETKRLAADTAKANKAGVEGSEQMQRARERVATASETVADRERSLTKAQEEARRTGVEAARDVADAQQALREAQAGVDKAREEGQRQIEDAQRAVADAAAAVAEAQAAAAAQTSKFDEAMAKLAPNARSFVNAVRGLAPQWDAMRLSVQNRLFEGLDSTVTQLGRTTIPVLQRQLTATAGVWNEIAKNAAAGVQEMARSGMLDKILAGATDNLRAFQDAPRQMITAWGQLSVAAQPAFHQLMTQFAGAIKSFSDGIAKSFESGGLEQAISSAFEIISQFGTLLGNALGVVQQIFKAASDAGGQIVGALASVFGELERVFAAPQMQAQLRSLFASVSQIVGALVPVLGAVVQAAVPLLAAVLQPIATLATALGPILQQLAQMLGAALLPIIQALAPALVMIGTTIVQLVASVLPLLQPIAALIAQVITSLAPALAPVLAVITQIVNTLVGPLTRVVQALTPALVQVADLVAQAFRDVEPLLAPLVGLLGTIAQLVADVFAAALQQLMRVLEPLIRVASQLVQTVLQALAPILPAVAAGFVAISTALIAIMQPLAGVVVSLAQQLVPIITDLTPIVGALASVFAETLSQVLPPLATAVISLAAAFAPVLPVVAELLGMILEMAAGVLMQLLPSLLELVQAAVALTVALLPIVPPLVELVGLVLKLAVGVVSALLPPLIDLAGFFISGFATALSTVIGWVSGLIRMLASLVTWIVQHVGPAFRWLNDKVVQPVWRAIREAIRWSWTNIIKPIFDAIKLGIQGVGGVFRWLRDHIVKPVWNTITSVIKTAWTSGIKPAFDAVKTAVGKVADAFSTAKDAIGKAWKKIEGLTKAPINFVIGTVWNKGVVKAWDKILGWVPGLPKLKELPLLAQGGTVPARPGIYNRPTAIVGEGDPRHPEFVIPTDPRYRSRALGLWEAAGGQLMADGGILGSIVGGIKSIGGKVGGFFSSAASFLKDPGKALDTLMGGLLEPLRAMKDSAWGKLALGIPRSILKGLKDLVSFGGGGGGGDIGGTIPKGQRLAVINQALAAAGVPPPGSLPQWQAGLNTLITRESGWNPRAINRWDSNARAGIPSQGLAQTIPPTWSAYVPASLRSRGILDPVSNVAAAVRYIVARYGNITNVQQANANRPPAGYDNGGWLQPGWNYNGLGTPEAVLTPQQLRILEGAAVAGVAAVGGLRPGDSVTLVVQDGPTLRAYVQGEAQQVVTHNNRQIATALGARPRG
jgi:phage-related protein